MGQMFEVITPAGSKQVFELDGRTISVEAAPGFSYRLLIPPQASRWIERDGDDLIVPGQSSLDIVVEDFFVNCNFDSPCSFLLSAEDGSLIDTVIPSTVPLAALSDGRFLMIASDKPSSPGEATEVESSGSKTIWLLGGVGVVAGALASSGAGGSSEVASDPAGPMQPPPGSVDDDGSAGEPEAPSAPAPGPAPNPTPSPAPTPPPAPTPEPPVRGDQTAPDLDITDNEPGVASGAVVFTFTFTEAVVGFAADDISVSSSAGIPTIAEFTSVTETTYELTVLPPAGEQGTMIISVGDSLAQDAAGNGNIGSLQIQPFNTIVTISADTLLSGGNGVVSLNSINAANAANTLTSYNSDHSVVSNPSSLTDTLLDSSLNSSL